VVERSANRDVDRDLRSQDYKSKIASYLGCDMERGTGARRATASQCGQGVRGSWESNPCLCATVQDFPKYVCVLLSTRAGRVVTPVTHQKQQGPQIVVIDGDASLPPKLMRLLVLRLTTGCKCSGAQRKGPLICSSKVSERVIKPADVYNMGTPATGLLDLVRVVPHSHHVRHLCARVRVGIFVRVCVCW
jgi:hypothetical protein